MLVVVLECGPPKLYGYLSSWALQVATGVYVADLPDSQRREIWSTIEQWATPSTRVSMIWRSAKLEQGLDCVSIGEPRRRVIEREGLLISTWIPRDQAPAENP